MERLPNILSTIRILLTPVFLVLFFEPELWIKLIALGVYIIAAITDFFDGYYARKYNIETSMGAFLDHLQTNYSPLVALQSSLS